MVRVWPAARQRRTAEVNGPVESTLVRRARHGDTDAFGSLVRLHQDAIYRLALRMVGPDAAEDIAQQAFLKPGRASAGSPAARPSAVAVPHRGQHRPCAAAGAVRRRRMGRAGRPPDLGTRNAGAPDRRGRRPRDPARSGPTRRLGRRPPGRRRRHAAGFQQAGVRCGPAACMTLTAHRGWMNRRPGIWRRGWVCHDARGSRAGSAAPATARPIPAEVRASTDPPRGRWIRSP